jgi:hypothetical protein
MLPTDILLIASGPLILIGLYYAYQQWRADHPRNRHHPAE